MGFKACEGYLVKVVIGATKAKQCKFPKVSIIGSLSTFPD